MDNYWKGDAVKELTLDELRNGVRAVWPDAYTGVGDGEIYTLQSNWKVHCLGDNWSAAFWSSDEAVVRAAHPKVWFSSVGFVWKSEHAYIGSIGSGIGDAYLGDNIAEARQHPTVQAWERQHNPTYAKPPQPAEKPAQTAETVTRPVRTGATLGALATYSLSADDYMDAQEVTIISLRERVKDLRACLLGLCSPEMFTGGPDAEKKQREWHEAMIKARDLVAKEVQDAE